MVAHEKPVASAAGAGRLLDLAKAIGIASSATPVETRPKDTRPAPPVARAEVPLDAFAVALGKSAKNKLASTALANSFVEKFKKHHQNGVDSGVLHVLEELLNVDETQLKSALHIRKAAVRLRDIAIDNQFTTKAGRDARRCLLLLMDEFPEHKLWLVRYAEVASPVVQGGVGAPTAVDTALTGLYVGPGDTLAGTQFGRLLNEYKLRKVINPRLSQPEILHLIRAVEEEGVNTGDIAHAQEAIRRLNQLQKAHRPIHEAEEGRGLTFTRETLRDVYGIDNPAIGDSIIHTGLPKEAVDLMLQRNYEGLDEWFTEFIYRIEGMSKDQARPDLPDIQLFNNFEEFIKKVFPGDEGYRLFPFISRWRSVGRIDGAVKHVYTAAGSLEDKLKGLRMVMPSEYQEHTQIEHFNDVFGLFGEAIREQVAQERIEWQQGKTWLFEKDAVVNNYYNLAIRRGEKPGEYKDEELVKLFHQRKLSRIEYLKILRQKAKEGDTSRYGALNQADSDLMHAIARRKREVGKGVFLRDKHMQNDAPAYENLVRLQDAYDTMKSRSASAAALAQQGELIKQAWRDYTLHPDEWRGPEHKSELTSLRGYSPIEMRARDLLIAKFREKYPGQKIPSASGGVLPEWKILRAVKTTRDFYIFSGEAAQIGARMAIPAGEMAGIPEYHTEWQMNRGFLEPLQRAMNGEWFAEDFTMGGKQGTEARKIWNYLIMKYRGGEKFIDSAEWKELTKNAINNPEDRRFVKMLEFAKDTLGTEFTELFRTGFLRGGLQFDQTSWRANVAILQEVQDKLLRLRTEGKLDKDAILNNQALGLQLIVADSPELKIAIMKKMMEREPSVLLQILGSKIDAIVQRQGIDPGGKEWRQLKQALVLAQQKLWDDPDLAVAHIDLAKRADFDKVVGKTLESMGITDRVMHDKFHTIIKDMQAYLNEKPRDFKTSTRLEQLALADWPLTLTMSDFNIRDADFMKLGMYSMERRINDFLGASTAMGKMFELMYKSDFFSPADYKETLKKLVEFRDTINGYDGPGTAEKATKAMLQLFVELNRNRGVWKWWSWLPGGVAGAKMLAEMDMRKLKWLAKIPLLRSIPGWEHLIEHDLMHWPHSIAEAISHSVAYTGTHGNAWSEFKIDEVLNEADKMGLFTENRDFIKDLKKDFKVTLNWKFMAVIRRYWWVVLAASIAMAATQAMDEEKKRNHAG